MRIKLVFPPAFDEAKLEMLPYGMCVLASHLRGAGFAVDQDDLLIKMRRRNIPSNPLRRRYGINALRDSKRVSDYLFNNTSDKKLDTLAEQLYALSDFDNYGIVCISVHSIFQFPFALLLARFIKKKHDPVIILGGPFITLRGLEFFKALPYVDYLVQGDGEVPAQLLLEYIMYQKGSLEQVPGLVYRKNGEILSNSPVIRPIEDSPKPDFDGLDLELYKHEINGRKDVVFTYQFSKGCTGRCGFCTHHILSGEFRIKSPEKIVRELKELVSRYGARYFYMCDSSINADHEALARICRAMARENVGIEWGSLARLDNMDAGLSLALKDSGCKFLRFGFESGSPDILKKMGKLHTAPMALETVKSAHLNGIKCLGTFIAGFPGETIADVNKTVEYVKDIFPYTYELECGTCYIEKKSLIEKDPAKYGIKELKENSGLNYNNAYRARHSYSFNSIEDGSFLKTMKTQVRYQKMIQKIIRDLSLVKHKKSILARLMPFSLYYFLGNNKFKSHILSYLYAKFSKDYYYTYSEYFE